MGFLRVYNADDFSVEKKLDFGKRSVISLRWHGGLNQLLVGCGNGECVMLYSPFSSKHGALHFVGRHRRAKEGHEIEGEAMSRVFCMTDSADIQAFYQTGRGNVQSERRRITRAEQKTTVPVKPAALDGKTATTTGTQLVSKVILETEGKSKYANDDSQKVLLEYADKEKQLQSTKNDGPVGLDGKNSIYMKAYEGNVHLLDYSVEDGAGDQMMSQAKKGDFCRKCGQKICRCVDYSQWGNSNKKPRVSGSSAM